MKKSYVFIGLFFVFIILISVIGVMALSGNVRIEEIDEFGLQSDREVYLTGYGYTLDNPNIILNPYGNSPLTALVMFETEKDTEVYVLIKGRNGAKDISYTSYKSRMHMIPIYGLYPDYDNVIVIKTDDREKTINIKTDKLLDDIKRYDNEKKSNFVFYNVNYPYMIDENGEIRWYLNREYYGNVTYLKDGKIILGSDRYTKSGDALSVYLMDLLGKIYKEYLVTDGYGGSLYLNSDDKMVILSDDILTIDIQTGEIEDRILLGDSYDYLGILNDEIIVGKDESFYNVSHDFEEITSYTIPLNKCNLSDSSFYYRIISPLRYGSLNATLQSKVKISLFGYKKSSQEDLFEISADKDRIIIKNNSEEKIYIILDKLLDKRIYEANDILYINKSGLHGGYTLYYKMGDKVYKTDYYIEV